MTIGLSSGESFETEFHLQDAFRGENPVIQGQNEPQKIYLIRHGDTEFNQGEGEEERIRGWSPVPLNQDGIDDAHKTAAELKEKGITSLVSSDLPRAKQTANIIGKELGITPIFNPKLRTWDMGELTGKPIKDHEVRCAEHVTDRPNDPVPGGESFNEFKDRVLGGFSEALQTDPEGTVGIVTHNSPERVMAAWQKAGEPADGSIHNETYLEKGEAPGGHQTFDVGPSIHDIQSMTHEEEGPNKAEPVLRFLREYRKGGLLHAIMGESEPEWSKKLHSFAQGLGEAGSFSTPLMGAMKFVPMYGNTASNRSFTFLNHEDKEIGSIDTTYNPRDKSIYVEYTSTNLLSPLSKGNIAKKANQRAHAIGTVEMRNLLYALKEEYPDAVKVGGFRVSGSRSLPGKEARGEKVEGRSEDQYFKMPKDRRPPGGNTPLDPEFERELSDLVKTVKPGETRIESPEEAPRGWGSVEGGRTFPEHGDQSGNLIYNEGTGNWENLRDYTPSRPPSGSRLLQQSQSVQEGHRRISAMTDEEWNAFERQLVESTREPRRRR